ncbi:hypothetical protein [Serratia proteamaculans]|uniref:hypothetical protein n=1 Tax=Serratia proteamaculans TaxID=28151 RepID=UPI003CF277A2
MKRSEQDKIHDEKTSRAIPVKEHITMMRLSWQLAKVGYLVMFSIVMLALLGFFSNGVFSGREAVSREGDFKINYERFARNGTQTQWRMRLKNQTNQSIRLSFPESLLEFYVIENVQPQSLNVTHVNRKIIFTLPVSVKRENYMLTFTLRPQKWGSFNALLADENGDWVEIKQWIYP